MNNYSLDELVAMASRLPPSDLYTPSSDWQQGGQVVQNNHIMLVPDMAHGQFRGTWRAVRFISAGAQGRVEAISPDPLQAAMTAFVRGAALLGQLPKDAVIS